MKSIVEKIEPRFDMLLVTRDPLPTSVGMIVMPEQRKIRPSSGVVERAGAGIGHEYPKGTRLIFSQSAGELFKFEGEEIMLLHGDEVQAVIAEEA